MPKRNDRRRFLQTTAAAGVGFWIAGHTSADEPRSPNDKLNFACIGVGGKGASDTDHAATHGNIVALCDIDDQRLQKKGGQFPHAKKYHDFRKLLEDLAPKLDAVVVSTADHCHAVAAVMAMKLGKHVYCQKPLTHSVHEARVMRETAAAMKVCTQMGNQGTASPGFRHGIDVIRNGIIGTVQEVHVWTNRPFKYWKQAPDIVARPKETPPTPEHVKWDLFLGPAPERPYHRMYHPHDWRGWWDFGTGAMGDMACHTANLPYMALKLGLPQRVTASSGEVNPETYPAWATITYEFPSRGTDLPPVKLTWYEGARDGKRNLPAADLFQGQEPSQSGSLLIGSKGALFSPNDYGAFHRLLPLKQFEGKQPAEPSQAAARATDPAQKAEWVKAIREGNPSTAWSNFAYAGLLTEAMLLGNVAVRVGKSIEYDAKTGKVTNCPDAAKFVQREYRKGWTL
jgi:predicted dehydrogenase